MTRPPDIDAASRVIVLGASNVSLGWRALTRTILRRSRRPLHVLTAHGMGRSYLGLSRFGMRSMPGILECGLWSELERYPGAPPQAALITDLGNDLVYGRTAADVVQAAEESVRRIRRINPDCEIVVTRPPLASVEALSRPRFYFFRTALFPLSGLSLSEVVEGTRELDAGIRGLEGVTTFTPRPEWYGFDPIHVVRRFRETAFQSCLDSWPADHDAGGERPESPIPRPTAGIRWVLGRQIDRPQPAVVTSEIVVSSW